MGLIMRRDEKIDIVRGLSMILIVLGHAGFPLRTYIYLFHVAVFFIIAGVCWKDAYSSGIKELKEFFKKKIYSLYIPYVAWLSLFSLLHNFFLKINFYSDNELFMEGSLGNSFGLIHSYKGYDFLACIIKNLLFLGNEPMAGASWFIRCLFFVIVLWTSVDFIIKKTFSSKIHILRLVISCIFMTVGNYLRIKQIYLPVNLSTMFSVYILFYCGVYYKIIIDKVQTVFSFNKIYRIIVCAVCVILLGVMNLMGKVELAINQYDGWLFLLTASICGWILLVELASVIRNDRVRKGLSIIGQNTLWILFLHFLVFKFINVLQVMLKGLPLYRIASYPTLYTKNGWWVVYTIAGITIPLCIKYIVYAMIEAFNNKKQKQF